jgi:hypothetical protein
MLVADGSNIPRQLGDSFGILPAPGSRFFCKFHRALLTEEEVADRTRAAYQKVQRPTVLTEALAIALANFQPPMMPFLPCEMRRCWPEDVPLHVLAEKDLPCVGLSDGQLVVCISTDRSLKPEGIRKIHWDASVEQAFEVRGELVGHAYDEAHFWLKTCADKRAGKATDPRLDVRLREWMSTWAEPMWNSPENKFTPSVEALEILHRVLGVPPSTLKSWMYR